jgi:homoserine kinase
MKVKIRVPATTSNLGSGFDILGAALTLYNDFEAETVNNPKQAGITVLGTAKNKLPLNTDNLVWRIMSKTFKTLGSKTFNLNNLKITINTSIPISSGLGSSASAIIGGIALANSLCGSKMTKSDIAQIATDIEGHPDNAFPAVFGGICLCYKDEQNKTIFYQMPKTKLKLVIINPSFEINTEESRKKLPKNYKTQDLIFNISRTALLTAAFYSKKYTLLKEAVKDKSHQPYRLPSILKSKEIFQSALEAGSEGVFLSGSGPSIAAFANINKAKAVAKAMSKVWSKANISFKTFILDFDYKGMSKI